MKLHALFLSCGLLAQSTNAHSDEALRGLFCTTQEAVGAVLGTISDKVSLEEAVTQVNTQIGECTYADKTAYLVAEFVRLGNAKSNSVSLYIYRGMLIGKVIEGNPVRVAPSLVYFPRLEIVHGSVVEFKT